MKCRLCGLAKVGVAYEGPIRKGGPESGVIDGFRVYGCDGCGVEFLDPFPDDLGAFYEGEAYWTSRQGAVDISALYKRFDVEQLEWFSRIGPACIREKRVADFGCGTGLFLDLIQGLAHRTIGIEPGRFFGPHLNASGHEHHHCVEEVETECIDVAVSFDTLEHLEDPKTTLHELHRCLVPGGRLYLGVPNREDFLTRLVPGYLSFFYHRSHLFYFRARTLVMLLEEAGFGEVHVSFVHKYDVMNLVKWARDGSGRGSDGDRVFDTDTEASFRRHVERQGISSHILVEAERT